jgi:hypothetical protein
MPQRTDPRLVVLLPTQGLGVEAACWDSLHRAYAAWMRQTRTYTTGSVAVLYALSCLTWDARSREGVQP